MCEQALVGSEATPCHLIFLWVHGALVAVSGGADVTAADIAASAVIPGYMCWAAHLRPCDQCVELVTVGVDCDTPLSPSSAGWVAVHSSVRSSPSWWRGIGPTGAQS